MARRPTIIDVAQSAGVSKSTVSLVLQDSPTVREETREQIVAAISQLHEAGIAAGTLRSDVTPDDVMRAVGAVWQVTDVEQARRLLRLLMDGLRSNIR